ncbi:MAG: hypothetical protein A3J63_04035 [Candidatus Moranbacteria bacterium RIFCSPHIGHO2_02_FULL_40_12b]|nr:MAG: hypothetical protein A3J63_04035 [Candidatus Moranbacteria bacterium RIFCSPHIGHO2_02_FULL_40_12b]
MSREKFEADFSAAKEEARKKLEDEYVDKAKAMDAERDRLKTDISAVEEKKKRLAEIEGNPEGDKEKPDILNFEQLKSWFKEKGLDKYFDLEKQVREQEKFWQEIYGSDFKIDRSKITKEAELLKAIEKGAEIGCINGIAINITPGTLTKEEAEMTEAQHAFHKLLESGGMDIWGKTGTNRWTELELKELLKRYLPVKCSDFNADNLQKDWVKEITRVIDATKPAPKQKPGKVELFFTDIRQDIPAEQKLVNLEGGVVKNPHSFVGAIANKINFTTPEEEIVLAKQMYSKDKTYISREFWEWMMAIVDHRDQKTSPPVSAARAYSSDGELILDSRYADDSRGPHRFRVRL